MYICDNNLGYLWSDWIDMGSSTRVEVYIIAFAFIDIGITGVHNNNLQQISFPISKIGILN